MSKSRRALLTFAFVSEGLKSDHDIFVGLAPLFNPIATSFAGEIFAPEKLAAELSERYGLTVTADIADYASFSLHKVGLLKRKNIGSNDVAFFWNAPPHALNNDPTTFEKNIEQIGIAAEQFAKDNPSLLNWLLDQDSCTESRTRSRRRREGQECDRCLSSDHGAMPNCNFRCEDGICSVHLHSNIFYLQHSS